MKLINIILLLGLSVMLWGCPKDPGFLVEDRYDGNKNTVVISPFTSNPYQKKAYRWKMKSLKEDSYSDQRSYATRLGDSDAELGVDAMSFLFWLYNGDYLDSHKRNRGNRPYDDYQLKNAFYRRGQIDSWGKNKGYPTRFFEDLYKNPYYQKGFVDESARLAEEKKWIAESYARELGHWKGEYQVYKMKKTPYLEETERLSEWKGELNAIADFYGFSKK